VEDNYNTSILTTQGAVGLQGGGGEEKEVSLECVHVRVDKSESSFEGNLGAQILVLTMLRI